MIWDYFLGLAAEYPWEELRQGMLGPTVVRSEPVGVAAAIVAWNVPQFITVSKIAPASGGGLRGGGEAVAGDRAGRVSAR